MFVGPGCGLCINPHLKRVLHAFITMACLFAWQPDWAQAAAPEPMGSHALEEFAEVVVTGEQPGPALWRVTSGDHVLWLLGGVSQLPGKVTWRSKRLEAVLSGSQEVLLDQGVSSRPRTKREGIAMNKATTLPGGKTLKDVLSSDLYARVEVARRAFAPGDKGFEKLRPFHAANRIAMGSMKPLGLAPFGARYVVAKLAAKERLPVTHIADTEGIAPSLTVSEADAATTPCLEAAVAILENGGAGVRALANAWSVGDIAALRELVPRYDMGGTNPRMVECEVALHGNERGTSDVAAKHAEKWLAAAERSLAANKSTVAVVSMSELLTPAGYLSALRARGYEIVEPHGSL